MKIDSEKEKKVRHFTCSFDTFEQPNEKRKKKQIGRTGRIVSKYIKYTIYAERNGIFRDYYHCKHDFVHCIWISVKRFSSLHFFARLELFQLISFYASTFFWMPFTCYEYEYEQVKRRSPSETINSMQFKNR